MMRGGWIANLLMMPAQRTTGAGNSRPAVTQKEMMVKMETLTWVKRKLVCLHRKPFMVALESNGATCLAESENPCHFDLFSMNSDFSFLTKPFSSCKFCAVKVYVQ